MSVSIDKASGSERNMSSYCEYRVTTINNPQPWLPFDMLRLEARDLALFRLPRNNLAKRVFWVLHEKLLWEYSETIDSSVEQGRLLGISWKLRSYTLAQSVFLSEITFIIHYFLVKRSYLINSHVFRIRSSFEFINFKLSCEHVVF